MEGTLPLLGGEELAPPIPEELPEKVEVVGEAPIKPLSEVVVSLQKPLEPCI